MTDQELIERLLFLAETAVDQALDLNYDDLEDYFIYRELRELKAAALAQPEPQGASDEEIRLFVEKTRTDWIKAVTQKGLDPDDFDVVLARAALARWGRPAIEPVPGVEGADA
jgi:hypothetical protein